MKPAIILVSFLTLAVLPQQAAAWGDDGHGVVALIAQHYLTPAAKRQVDAILAADTDPLTMHNIASEATWADKFRDSNNRRDHYEETKRWHFVDLEITDPDMTKACFGRKPLPSGTLASNGDKMACVIDKVAQFADELGAPGQTPRNACSLSNFFCISWAICINRCTPPTITMRVATASR